MADEEATEPGSDDKRQKMSGAQNRTLRELKDRVVELEATTASQQDQIDALRSLVDETLPPKARAFAHETVRRLIGEDCNLVFEVLGEFKPPGHGNAVWKCGRQIKASSYPQLLEFVQKGLLIAKPRDQDRHVESMRRQIRVHADAARASTAAIEAHKQEAQAATDAAQAVVEADTARDVAAKITAGKRSVHFSGANLPPGGPTSIKNVG